MQCSKCFGEIKLGDYIDHSCGHYTHPKCMPKTNRNWEECSNCDKTKSNPQDTLPTDEQKEFEGRDYIDDVGDYIKYNPKLDLLFKNKPSIEKIVLGKKIHLQELLANGVTIDTFIDNGYDWNDLLLFKDLSEKTQRRTDTLYALGCNAEHFRAYPKKLPYKEMGVTSEQLMGDFGLSFSGDDELSVEGGINEQPWRMDDIVMFQLTNTDLMRMGLKNMDQYYALGPNESEIDLMINSYFKPDIIEPRRAQNKKKKKKKKPQTPVRYEKIVVKPRSFGLKKK